MRKPGLNFYLHAILDAESDVVRIRRPTVSGKNSAVFVVEKSDGRKVVFRFDSEQNVRRNYQIGHILNCNGITSPDVNMHMCRGQFFETYPYLTGKTLAEKLKIYGSDACSQDVCAGIAAKIKQLSKIPVYELNNVDNNFCHQVARKNMQNATHNVLAGTMVKYGTIWLNRGEKSVCHCDLTPENIIVDDKCQATAILDLNAISVANVNFALAIAGLGLMRYDVNPDMLYQIAADMMPGQVNVHRIESVSGIYQKYLNLYKKVKNR